MKKVSVIIPIYNVEQYLVQCLDSVINQTYKNLEIICVNDCSPDSSAKILAEYAEKDSRIEIINRKNNGGLSTARNSGLDAATGEYIYFIDSDDWIDLNYIEKMVDSIEKYDLELVSNTNIIEEAVAGTKPYLWNRYKKQLPEGEFLDKVTAINNSQCMIWCHLYKRDFLIKNNLRFPEGYIHEDEYFQHVSKNLLENIFAFYGPSYHYRKRHDSIMMFRLDNIAKIENEYDFNLLKKYVDKIGKNFEDERMASCDYEKYLYDKIIHSTSFEEYCKKIGKYPLQLYLSRGKILRNKNIKVSIIIPVYNVEKYLRKCLDSVCAQTLEDIEIICVNDCSKDDSIEILKEYASKDNRIKIIDFKENRGVAVARNEAIKIATGEYIGFVDSDDWIDLDFYEKLYKKASYTSSQIAIANAKKIVNNKYGNFVTDIENIKKNKVNFNGWFWLAIYSLDFLKKHFDIKFIENLTYGEDRIFPILAIYYAKKITTVPSTSYYYNIRQNSACTTLFKNEKRLLDMIKSLKLVLDTINILDYNKKDYEILYKEFYTIILFHLIQVPPIKQVLIKEVYRYYWQNVKYKEILRDNYYLEFNKDMQSDNINAIKEKFLLKQKKELLQNLRQVIKRGIN